MSGFFNCAGSEQPTAEERLRREATTSSPAEAKPRGRRSRGGLDAQ